jgi:hypothetical protein
MFNLGALAANVLNSLDSAAKETLQEPTISATALRSQRLQQAGRHQVDEDDDINDDDDEDEDFDHVT